MLNFSNYLLVKTIINEIDVAAAAGGPEYNNHFNITGSSRGTLHKDFYGCAIATTDEAKNGDKTAVNNDPHTTQQNFQSSDVDVDDAAAAGGA